MLRVFHVLPYLLFINLIISQNKVNENNLVKYGNKYFKQNDDTPFTGIVFDMSKKTGSKILEYKMIDGQKNGFTKGGQRKAI